MVFVVGARRSGTNWVQRVLAAHPDVVAVTSETSLFSHGLSAVRERFHHAAIGSPRSGATHMDASALADALRTFCDSVFLHISSALDPAAERIIERTPDHVRHLPLISEVYPDAWIIHVVRDGRDVARSLLSQSWGPGSMADAATEWRTAIEAARAAAPELARYREVRYEELIADPARGIRDLWAWLGLSVDEAAISAASIESGVAFNVDAADRVVEVGKWQRTLTPGQLADFNAVAADTLALLGYEPSSAAAPVSPGTLAAEGRKNRRTERRAREAITRRRRLRATLATVEGFLEAVHTRRTDELRRLFASDASVRIDEGGSSRPARGDVGVEALIEAIDGRQLFQGKQVRGDIHPAIPAFTVVTSYERDADVIDHTAVIQVDGDKITRLVVYVIPRRREPSG
jgi:hypothetical protein